MESRKIQFTIHNPNTEDETTRIFIKIIAEIMARRMLKPPAEADIHDKKHAG